MGVILYSIYRGRKKVNLPQAALTAGPPLFICADDSRCGLLTEFSFF